MLKKLKNIIMSAAAVAMLLTPALVPATASALLSPDATANGTCQGTQGDVLGNTGSSVCQGDTAPAAKLNDLISKAVNLFSVIVGVIAVIMIIVGGMKYIISGGESTNVSGAKNTIIYALVGLIIVALAQVIVHFVLAKLGNA